MAEMTIRRFGVLSVAKIYGLLWFILGLVIGVLYGLFFIIFGAAISAMGPGRDSTAGGVSTIVIGIVAIIVVPIFYGLIGFIAGAISALVYNVTAGVIGGVKFELEGVQHDYAPPPPPSHWQPHQA
jgi:hypothetical protein